MINNPLLVGSPLENLTGIQYVQKLLPVLITIGFVVGSVIFLFVILLGGIQWMTSGGDKTQIETARNRITMAIVGLIILFSIYAITSLVDFVFGVSITLIDLSFLEI